MSVKGRTVAVTGAGGFIGSHLVEGLVREGAQVRAFVHYNSLGTWGLLEQLPEDILESVQIVAGDVQDPFSVEKLIAGCNVVYHLAALIGIPYSYHAPQSYVATNINGTLNVLEACRQADVERVIHTSTSETYGTAIYTPIDEKHPLQGQSPYSASKIAADKIAESYYLSFDLPVVTIRPFNNFGPRQSARAVIPTIISQALTCPTIELGLLSPVRDYVYVTDTVSAFLRAATARKVVGRVINVGSGKSSSIADIAKLILDLLGAEKEIVNLESRTRPSKSEVMELLCDNSLARELLGWQPTVSFEGGLRRTIDWISENKSRYKSHIYNV